MNTLDAYVGKNVNKRTITSPSHTQLKHPIATEHLKTKLVTYKSTPRIIQGYSENLFSALKLEKYNYENDNKKTANSQEQERNSETFFEDYETYEDFEDIHIFLKSQHISIHDYD